MATRSVNPARRGLPGVRQVADSAARRIVEYVVRPQLFVIAPSMVSVVRFAGGWVFDRVMAGWDVTVLTAEPADTRPLQILGARVGDLDGALAAPMRGMRPQAIAVEAGLFGADERVRRVVQDAFDKGVAEIRIWDGRGPESRAADEDAVEHRLSVAARAFKARALEAAAAPVDPVDLIEMFRTGQPELVPAA